LAYGAVKALVSIAPPGLPRLDEIAIEPAVLAFAAVVSLVAGVLFGLIPVLKYVTPGMVGGLREGGRGNSQSRERHRARNLLVVTQVALALVLLIGAGLMIRTIHALSRVQPGFADPDSLLTLRISIPEAQVKEPARVLRMENDIADRIAAVAGVRSVGVANTVVLEGRASNDPIYAEDKVYAEGQLPPIRRYKAAGPGFFKTMGNPLVAGRDFSWTDTYNAAPVVILSENLARELWQRPEAAIGKRVRESPKGSWREVIGVVGDERDNELHRPAPAIAYWPLLVKNMWGETERVRRDVIFAIRGPRAGSQEYAREVERAVWAVNPELPIASIRTMREIYLRSTARSSFALSIMAIVGGMALLLGVVGIYGVISYSVSRRTREIGIRMALGAEQGQVRRMFLRDGLVLAGVGVAIGLTVAFGVTRLMTSLLFGVSAADPVTYSGGARFASRLRRGWPAIFPRGVRRRLLRWWRCGRSNQVRRFHTAKAATPLATTPSP
jgi:predicted permease